MVVTVMAADMVTDGAAWPLELVSLHSSGRGTTAVIIRKPPPIPIRPTHTQHLLPHTWSRAFLRQPHHRRRRNSSCSLKATGTSAPTQMPITPMSGNVPQDGNAFLRRHRADSAM